MTSHDTWEKIHSSRAWGSYPSEHVIRFVARNYYQTTRENIKILDFGCGQGAHTWYLAREGFDTYAFDISESAVEKVNSKLAKEELSAHVRVLDGVRLDYPQDFFDAVIDSACITANQIVDIQTMYQGVFKILKPGGKFLTCGFGKSTTGYGTGTMLEPNTYEDLSEGSLQHIGCLHFFEREELLQMLADVGFEALMLDFLTYTDHGNRVEIYIAVGTKRPTEQAH